MQPYINWRKMLPLENKFLACLSSNTSTAEEFVSQALLKWIVDQGIGTALIDPGSPGRMRVGGFQRRVPRRVPKFRSRGEAKVLIEAWRQHFNNVRPHSSLGYLTPAGFATQSSKRQRSPKRRGRAPRYLGPSRPAPSHNRPQGKPRQQSGWSQVKPGPKKLGRSLRKPFVSVKS
jgi:hypothetical protein